MLHEIHQQKSLNLIDLISKTCGAKKIHPNNGMVSRIIIGYRIIIGIYQ